MLWSSNSNTNSNLVDKYTNYHIKYSGAYVGKLSQGYEYSHFPF